jgi:hypothetical protein
VFDAYTRRARLAPAALAALPPLALLGSGLVAPQHLVSAVAIAAGAIGIVVCGVVRDLGRKVQPDLWRSWGGSPTVRRLRWRDATDQSAVARRHARVESVTGEPLPRADEELADPAAADERYDEAIAVLRDLTRNDDDFPLVFEENATYGFRRNCLGLRPVALAVAAVSLALSVVLLVTASHRSQDHTNRFGIAAAIAVIAVLAWWLLVTRAWVRSSAELYADQLLESVETLRRRERA